MKCVNAYLISCLVIPALLHFILTSLCKMGIITLSAERPEAPTGHTADACGAGVLTRPVSLQS